MKNWFFIIGIALTLTGCDSKKLPNGYEIFTEYSGSNGLATPKGRCVLGGADTVEGSITEWVSDGGKVSITTANNFEFELDTVNSTLIQLRPTHKVIDMSQGLTVETSRLLNETRNKFPP